MQFSSCLERFSSRFGLFSLVVDDVVDVVSVDVEVVIVVGGGGSIDVTSSLAIS